MIRKECFSRDWIYQVRASHFPKSAPQILEKTIHTFELLCLLVKSELPFVFKGGTSLLLLLSDFTRLSIDIDIITDVKELDLNPIVEGSVFKRVEPDIRLVSNIPKSHYRFYYDSIFGIDDYILLDIINDKTYYKHIKLVRIRSPLIEIDEIINVRIPSVDDIIADKLTAFAPHTIGIPLKRHKEAEIIKQLYDLGNLYEKMNDISVFRETYFKAAAQELNYRSESYTVQDILRDTLRSALAFCQMDLKGFTENELSAEYRLGMTNIRGYLMDGRLTFQTAKIYASRIALLIALLLNQDADIQTNDLLFSDNINTKINQFVLPDDFRAFYSLRKTNAECYYNLYLVSQLLKDYSWVTE